MAFSLLLLPGSAWAYGGPGSVVSGIGALIALVATIVASIFGFLWFPIKILWKKLFGDEKKKGEKENSKNKEEN